MKYILDTSTVVDHLRGRKAIPEETIQVGASISIITYGELCYGAYKSANPPKTFGLIEVTIAQLSLTIVDLSSSVMEIYAQLKATLEVKGTRLDDLDLMIAATALHHSCVLLTRNRRHFERIPDLILYNR